MKKYLSIKNLSQAVALAVILTISWVVVSLFRFIKNEPIKQSSRKTLDILPSFLATPSANADAPAGGGSEGGDGGGGASAGASTPFLAIWDGNKYRLENDILFGKPTSFFSDFASGKLNHKKGSISGDLYKIQSKFQKKDGAFSFQLQEIEDEESFFHGITLKRILHPKGSEVFIDADYKQFYVFNKKQFEENLIKPTRIIDYTGKNLAGFADSLISSKEVLLQSGDYIDIEFRNLDPNRSYSLVLKSRFRQWTPGKTIDQKKTLVEYLSPEFLKNALVAGLLFLGALMGKSSFLAGLPLVMLCESSGSGDSSEGGSAGGGGGGCSLWVYAHGQSGVMKMITHFESRALKHVIELANLSKELLNDNDSGALILRIRSTDHHHVSFVALTEKTEELPYEEENMEVSYAWHSRLKRDVTENLKYSKDNYLHLIPGDIVEVTFESEKTLASKGMKSTYLMQSSGFYTRLTPESEELLGINWERSLSPEAQRIRASLS